MVGGRGDVEGWRGVEVRGGGRGRGRGKGRRVSSGKKFQCTTQTKWKHKTINNKKDIYKNFLYFTPKSKFTLLCVKSTSQGLEVALVSASFKLASGLLTEPESGVGKAGEASINIMTLPVFHSLSPTYPYRTTIIWWSSCSLLAEPSK